MIKIIKYLIQSLIIYSFFLIGKLIGLKLSRKLFGYMFKKLGLSICNNMLRNTSKVVPVYKGDSIGIDYLSMHINFI